MNDQDLSYETTGGLFYRWMPTQQAKPYGSFTPKRKQVLNKKDLCKRCHCDISDLTIRTAIRKYCDPCNLEIRREKNRTRHIKKTLEPRACSECLEIFTPKKKTTAEFCSNTCWSRNKRGNKGPKICEECHNEIALPKNLKYCGNICMNISRYRRAIIRLESLRIK